ncbi:arabinosylfuranosidase ArfA [Microlunatus flavus]|uniref:non-reducing end alpha-L-arabinofuranosidase n=1 Tax=Microlunatus flavus TaxID=1036181 RepID=A0A1H9ADJ4_9ACTN|nr:alpha-N-arabinofuranosidase [Microlunatus flavus]SEP74601.1 alpha-N-arabinofuranosidase [Microlunatus flavus]
MTRARIVVDRDFTLGEVPRRIFGSFVEHMGRCVYTGVFEPGHPAADEDGFRTDVLELTREMGVSVVRYPGGNFVSGYRWEDGVGPVADRPRRLDGAWHTVESNAFGLHEFVAWAKKADVEVMEAINLGTRGVEAARELVEYANHPGGTALSDRRIANGAKDPFGIKLWCLGNEMDGPWQIGHKTADEYGRLAQEAAKAMRYVDSSLELVVCGSSGSLMPTFGAWEQTVLGHAYDEVDYVSMHAYYEESGTDHASFLASAVDMDHFIESVVATIDAVGAARKSRKKINISFDEWNVWYQGRDDADSPSQVGKSGWVEHPRLIEDVYTVTDAVVVGTFLNSLLRHGDRVTIANQAQLVNIIAPILTEPGGAAWRQSIFWPFARTSALAQGEILRLHVDSEVMDTPRYGDAALVDVSGTYDADAGTVALFLANRSVEEAADVEVDLRGLIAGQVLSAEVLTVPEGGDRHSVNAADDERVRLQPLGGVSLEGEGSVVRLRLPALSWSAVQLEVASA